MGAQPEIRNLIFWFFCGLGENFLGNIYTVESFVYSLVSNDTV